MKKILLFSFFLVMTFVVKSQTYLISSQGTVDSCSGDFYDSGSGGNYADNENYVMTFHSPNLTNTHTKMSFNSFDVEPSDTLIVYDGSTIAAPVIGKYNNNNPPPSFVKGSISNLTGDLTFQFKSDGALNTAGWFASLACIPQCQDVLATLNPTLTLPHPNDSNYVDICIGNTIQFAARGSGIYAFPQDNILYDQDSTTTTYTWDFGDGTTGTGQFVTKTYTAVRGYDVALNITDVRGCVNSNYLGCRVRISQSPFAVVNPLPDMCSSTDTSYITIGYNSGSVFVVEPINSHQSASQRFDSTTFIPDGNLCSVQCYNTFVSFAAFAPGTTITSASDVLSICVNMEHSFAGDLGFTIICPNGQSVQLDPNTHSGGAFLGSPLDNAPYDNSTYPCDAAYNAVGPVGWTYCWSEIYPQHGTFDYLSSNSLGTMDSTNTIAHNNYITPNNPLTGLIGCPLNGTWNIQICDDYSSDNGYIFWWELNLDPSLLPTGWGYTVPIDTVYWTGSFFSIVNDSTIMVIPDSGGTYQYTVTVVDAFGCSYDTTLNIQVVQTPDFSLGHDTILCGNNINYTLDPGPGSSFNWSTGSSIQTQPVTSTGLYWVTVTNSNVANTLHCSNTDTVFIKVLALPTQPDLGPDQCSTVPVTLECGVPGFQYDWSTNASTQSITAPVTGMYSVTIAEEFGFNCNVSDSVHITVIPVPTITIGSDTSMCSYNLMRMRVTDANNFLDQYNYSYLWTTDPISELNGQTTRDIVFGCIEVGKTYKVTVAVTGCTTVTDTRNVESKNCALTLYNVITPNGDGQNDIFKVDGIEDFPNSNLKVYNRWGKKIYESDDYNGNNNAWDGGKEAAGVYYYVLTVNYGDHGDCVDVKNFSGTITLIR